MNEIILVTSTDIFDNIKMKYLLESAKHTSNHVKIIEISYKFSWINRIKCFHDFLLSLHSVNPIICFTDAYDVIYTDNDSKIKEKFLSFKCDILWSVEKWYSHQLKSDKEFYDNLNESQYRYINGGTFIGYKTALLCLFHDLLEISLKDKVFINELNNDLFMYDNNNFNGNDQTWISHHLAKNWGKYNIKLDYECDIFYVPCGDWDEIDNYIDENLNHKITGKKPSIIHVPWKSKYENILLKLFNLLH